MAQSFKRLGAINPTANTQTNVYVVPAATEAVVSTVTICNQSASNASFSLIMMPASVFASPAGAAHFLIRGAVVPAAASAAHRASRDAHRARRGARGVDRRRAAPALHADRARAGRRPRHVRAQPRAPVIHAHRDGSGCRGPRPGERDPAGRARRGG